MRAFLGSCFEKVIFVFILGLAAVVLIGASVDAGGAEKARAASSRAGGECQVSSDFPAQVYKWCSLITRQANQNQLSPDLVAALIYVESNGSAQVVSRSGAIGLMQVMPRDGKAAAFQCKNGPCFADRPTMQELKDPEFNVQFGTQFLQSLVRRHNGSLREALRSYGPMDVGYRYADLVLATYRRYGAQP
jgi:soluble lytic murein transglycosylase-like protein